MLCCYDGCSRQWRNRIASRHQDSQFTASVLEAPYKAHMQMTTVSCGRMTNGLVSVRSQNLLEL